MRGTALTPLGVEDVKRELPEIFGPGPTLGKVGEGWSTGVQGVEMGRQHETVVGLLLAIWDPLGPERSTGAFKELMKTSFGTFPS